jgi:preprotein translocase subunit SecA
LVDFNVTPEQFQKLGKEGVKNEAVTIASEFYKRKEEKIGAEIMGALERMAMLQVIDIRWKEHLREMDDLKEGIHLRAFGQKDPILEYKWEAFRMFMEMIGMINREALNLVFKLFPETTERIPIQRTRRSLRKDQLTMTHDAATGLGFQANREPVEGSEGARGAQPSAPKVQQLHAIEKVGRNDPCPCGSGKKYKNCHGK